MTTSKIPASSNEEFGFFGTMGEHAAVAWPLACRAIARMTTATLPEIRAFLDSAFGRHFADAVLDNIARGLSIEEAVTAAASAWKARPVSSGLAKFYRIPARTSFLVAAIRREAAAA